ncbi:MAG: class I SAM-dependent methyltransferase [Clostridiales bacterium]|nr:class I SAM-dependent methyltransferase [Clostridiales bacterium]
MSAYEGLARYYDGLTTDVDYAAWLDWYQSWFRESRVPVQLVLDLACGTGTLTCMLAERGYTMIGADLSPEMLAEAAEKAQEVEGEPPIFLNQAMDQLDLFGTIDACVSSLDSVNYITDRDILAEAFRRVHTFLMPGGYFLFDIIAPQGLQALDGELFADETEDVFCLWRADFDEDSRVLTYGMDLFEREGGLWRREQEEHRERAWEVAELKSLLQAAGFAQVQVFGGLERREPTPEDRRLCFVCVNGEGGQLTMSN